MEEDRLVSKSWRFTHGENKAINILKNTGYSFPANTQIGVLRKALQEAWNKQFPNEPFPPDEEA